MLLSQVKATHPCWRMQENQYLLPIFFSRWSIPLHHNLHQKCLSHFFYINTSVSIIVFWSIELKRVLWSTLSGNKHHRLRINATTLWRWDYSMVLLDMNNTVDLIWAYTQHTLCERRGSEISHKKKKTLHYFEFTDVPLFMFRLISTRLIILVLKMRKHAFTLLTCLYCTKRYQYERA